MLRVRAGDYFAGNSAYYAGATDTSRGTICDDTSMEGGWAHTFSFCFNSVIKGMQIKGTTSLFVWCAMPYSTPKKETRKCTPTWRHPDTTNPLFK